MTAPRRTPAQDNILRGYRMERRFGYRPLDAINNVRSRTACIIASFVAMGREVPPPLIDEWRAVEVALTQIRTRDIAATRINLRTIGRKPVAA